MGKVEEMRRGRGDGEWKRGEYGERVGARGKGTCSRGGGPLDVTLWSVGSQGHVRKAEKDREEQKERNEGRWVLSGGSSWAPMPRPGEECRPTRGSWPWGSWGRSQEYSSSRSTLTSMVSVCVKLLTRPESRPVKDRA